MLLFNSAFSKISFKIKLYYLKFRSVFSNWASEMHIAFLGVDWQVLAHSTAQVTDLQKNNQTMLLVCCFCSFVQNPTLQNGRHHL